MQMVRDALLSQLQKDRLRQEIIVEELAKIERSMALRSAAAGAERARPAPFDFDEQFMKTHGTGAVGTDGEASHLKDDGVRQCKSKRSKEHHATEDGLVGESSKTSSRATGGAARDRKNGGKPQESSDVRSLAYHALRFQIVLPHICYLKYLFLWINNASLCLHNQTQKNLAAKSLVFHIRPCSVTSNQTWIGLQLMSQSMPTENLCLSFFLSFS
jgi:hypothetical protein